ncbi:5985_t:CDS:1 [Paraglomus occultum]|uniref:5985_t:CDS:1 n=1 Tax=Paraglomus occultum TaxID=144539 RepID=A0A9N9FK13_9GLOM|nr:5985_t:CDS:1 [Paraglomus occultum]
MGNQTLSEFYKKDKKAKTIVQQIYNYMARNELQFGILTTYEDHWFMWRPTSTKVFISHTLQLKSAFPLVLKAWAYLGQRAEKDYYSPNTLLINVKSELQSGNSSQGTTHC